MQTSHGRGPEASHNRTLLQIFPLFALLAAIACGGGGGTPTQSTAVVVPWNQTGHVVATSTQTPVAGAHVSTAVASADTNGNGDFTLTATSTPTASQAVTVSASGYITHETTMRVPRTGPGQSRSDLHRAAVRSDVLRRDGDAAR